MYTTGDQP